MTDHAHYVHAVADALSAAGLDVRAVGGHDWAPRGGHILLGLQDGRSGYRYVALDVRWDEGGGWRCTWGGLTYELPVPLVAAPHSVVAAAFELLGPGWDGTISQYRDADPMPGSAEFDAALAAYAPRPAMPDQR